MYRIEIYWKEQNKWMPLGVSFRNMRKSFAQGAWAMLKAHYGEETNYRLVTEEKEPEIIDTWSSPTVSVN